jgi:energy-coupling factor transporter ATP-binding protein EcfA2
MAARKRAKTKTTKPPERSGIARITVEGFKSLARQTIELGRLNVLIGANGSGKTAMLEAIGLLGAAVTGRVDAGELMRRGVRASAPQAFMTALGDAPAKRIRLEAEGFAGASYSVTLAPPSGKWPNLWRFEAEHVQEGGKGVFRRKGDVAQRFSGGRWVKDVPLQGPEIGAAMRALSVADRPALRELFFTLADAVIFEPKTSALRGLSAAEPLDPLGLDGSGLAPALKSLQTPDGGIGPFAREQVLALIDWASGIEVGRPDLDVASPSVPMTQEIVRFVDRRMTAGRNVVSAFDASEGALYVLFALALLFHPHTPRLLGVEGLDHALHPRLARALVRTMGEHVGAAGKQIVLTTHNPLVLDGLALGNDDIRLFTVDRTEAGATVIRRVAYTEALRKAEASGATMSQMWLDGLLGAVPPIW